MFEAIKIQSSRGEYSVSFAAHLLDEIWHLNNKKCHFIVDANIAKIYRTQIEDILISPNTIVIEAREENKTIQNIISIFEQLVKNKVRRDHVLFAIGGGVIQDITCFISSTLFRGISWKFIPTTLLAQADSCIGSKSSINLGNTKNILGTFNPPLEVFICTNFLDSLGQKEICSGIGEILKVHAIDSASSFDRLAADFDLLFSDRELLCKYIREALLIKRRYIEIDEYDLGIRNIFNYGHSFGHAIEAATEFSVPHGVAVSMGMDMANCISSMRSLTPKNQYLRMHKILSKNYKLFKMSTIPFDLFLDALMKDKKNTSSKLVLILPIGEEASIKKVEVSPDSTFQAQCKSFFEGIKNECH